MTGRDSKGQWWRWGPAGHGGVKYYGKTGASKAMLQARAIEWSKQAKRVGSAASKHSKVGKGKPKKGIR
jgi:hypothetical protein